MWYLVKILDRGDLWGVHSWGDGMFIWYHMTGTLCPCVMSLTSNVIIHEFKINQRRLRQVHSGLTRSRPSTNIIFGASKKKN